MSERKGVNQHKSMAMGNGANQKPEKVPATSTRFAEGGYAKSGALAQTRGARGGFAHRTGKNKG